MKVHRLRLPGRLLCSIRSNRKWCKRRGSSLQCQNCFFVYPIIDCNLKNLSLSSIPSQAFQINPLLKGTLIRSTPFYSSFKICLRLSLSSGLKLSKTYVNPHLNNISRWDQNNRTSQDDSFQLTSLLRPPQLYIQPLHIPVLIYSLSP